MTSPRLNLNTGDAANSSAKTAESGGRKLINLQRSGGEVSWKDGQKPSGRAEFRPPVRPKTSAQARLTRSARPTRAPIERDFARSSESRGERPQRRSPPFNAERGFARRDDSAARKRPQPRIVDPQSAGALPLQLFLPCAAGTEVFLMAEITQLLQGIVPPTQIEHMPGGVFVRGNKDVVMRLNLFSRLAQRVLLLLARAPCTDVDALYQLARDTAWDDWFDVQRTIKVEFSHRNSPMQRLQFAALVVKDAVCDRFRERFGARPSVDTAAPDIRIFVHSDESHAWLYLDSSGEPLFKRGWRGQTGIAPLKETLAAAMIAATGWKPSRDSAGGGAFYDPCCGSGTVAIEAAQIACRIPAGLQRRFAFERFLGFDQTEWQELIRVAKSLIRPSPVKIYASDIEAAMVEIARKNVQVAGVAAAIELRVGDAAELLPPDGGDDGGDLAARGFDAEINVNFIAGSASAGFDFSQSSKGVLCLNPPYGERMALPIRPAGVGFGGVGGALAVRAKKEGAEELRPGEALEASAADEEELRRQDFFVRLGTHWKQQFGGWHAWVLSPDKYLPGRLRMQTKRRVVLWNGPLECRLFGFDILPARRGAGRDLIRGNP